MAFHFPLMPRLFMGLRMEDRFPIVDILEQTPSIPQTCQWALFLRNHDELTLEMVTDEERIYMYRTYAHDAEARINLGIRRRLAPLLRNDRRRIELLNGLLCALPGTPVIYYGDEIGMGDNIYLGDRNGVRTPMQWSADRNAGFSRANPQQLYLPLIVDHEYHHETVHVEAQQRNPSSLLHWMKRLLALRKRFAAFGRGSIEILTPENRKVLAFIRRYEDEAILVVANLSRFLQHVQLDLAALRGCCPIELFGRTRFPPIGEQPYLLTLGPHAFYWFALAPQPVKQSRATNQAAAVPTIVVAPPWENVVRGDGRLALEDALPAYLRARNWFLAKHRTILSTTIEEYIPLATADGPAYTAIVGVRYADDESQTYVLPLACARGEAAQALRATSPHAIIANVRDTEGHDLGVLYDAMWGQAFGMALLDAVVHRRRFQGIIGTAAATPTPELRKLLGSKQPDLVSTTLHATHNNTAIVYGDRLILKLFRCVDEGVNPELEIGNLLTKRGFAHTPQVLGAIEYRGKQNEPLTLAILQAFVPNQGELSATTQTQLAAYFTRAATMTMPDDQQSITAAALLELAERELPAQARELIGTYLDTAQLLGQRTAELHVALSCGVDDANFAPYPFTTLYQRSLYQSMRSLIGLVCDDLRLNQADLPEGVRASVRALLDGQQPLLQHMRSITVGKIDAVRIRCHGDYHLAQVLDTGDDLVIFDFEGESHRPVLERRLKRPALEDVASMLWSLHDATFLARQHQALDAPDDTEHHAMLDVQACFWTRWVAAAFLRTYLTTAGQAPFVPPTREQRAVLLDVLLIEKAFQQLDRDLRERPERLPSALQHLAQVLGDTAHPAGGSSKT
jgi:maltose alpha-D-glucosyltransferase / alpha-amylase